MPIDADRSPRTTLQVATTLARQSGASIEFVGGLRPVRAGPPRTSLQTRCRDAVAAGAAHASWAVLDATGGDVGWYATWSGSSLLCFSTRRHRPNVDVAGGARLRSVLRSSAIPVLVVGPRARPSADAYRRLVVALDGSATATAIATAAAETGRRMGLHVVFTEVVPITHSGGDVHESAYLHRIAGTVPCPGSTFDILHDRRPADGIVGFVDRDERSIIALGMPVAGHHGLQACGHVARTVVRHAVCPVLIVPVRAATAPGSRSWSQVRDAS